MIRDTDKKYKGVPCEPLMAVRVDQPSAKGTGTGHTNAARSAQGQATKRARGRTQRSTSELSGSSDEAGSFAWPCHAIAEAMAAEGVPWAVRH
jgi:hypothetical protein